MTTWRCPRIKVDGAEPERGYTKIPNSIIEALCRVKLSSYEVRVVLFIFRKTYGWHKEADRLPLSQICSATGIARSNVCRALKSLEGRNIIIRRGGLTAFQRDCDKWAEAPGKDGPMKHRSGTGELDAESRPVGTAPRGEAISDETAAGLSRDNKSSSAEIPSKESIKETYQGRDRTSSSTSSSSRRVGGDPRVKGILAEIAKRAGHKLAHYEREAREVKNALKDYEAEQILGCWEEMKRSPFWAGRYLPLAVVTDQLGLFVQGRLRVGRRSSRIETPKRYARPDEIG